MYKNPKATKQEIKFWFFYFVDLGLMIGLMVMASYIKDMFRLSGKMQIVYYILTCAFGVFLCMKTKEHPLDRNIQMLYYLCRTDRNKYYAIGAEDSE